MAGMLDSNNEDKKAAIADLSNLASMYAQSDLDSGGIMGVPKGDTVDAGSWWSWLTGTTRQKSDEYRIRAQEDLQGMDFSGAPEGYQRSMEEDLAKLLRMRGEAGPKVQTSVTQPMLSDELTARENLPVSELTDDEYFLRTGELRETLSPAPVEDDRPSTGLMSPDQSAIDRAVEEAMNQGEPTENQGEPTERLDAKGLTPVTTTSHAQQRLSDLGYVEVGSADGVAGANTRTAVRRYQQQNGLAATGRLDTPTLESLTGAEADLDTVVQRQIAHHEGQKNYPYLDSEGFWTIGIGHLIGDDEALAASDYSEYSESNPMPESEVTELFEEDLEDHKAIAEGYDFYEGMSKKGKRAILDLTFNMGDFYNKKLPNGNYEWANLRTQLDAGKWDEAADNLASSAYAQQVGQRASTVTDLLRQAGD